MFYGVMRLLLEPERIITKHLPSLNNYMREVSIWTGSLGYMPLLIITAKSGCHYLYSYYFYYFYRDFLILWVVYDLIASEVCFLMTVPNLS